MRIVGILSFGSIIEHLHGSTRTCTQGRHRSVRWRVRTGSRHPSHRHSLAANGCVKRNIPGDDDETITRTGDRGRFPKIRRQLSGTPPSEGTSFHPLSASAASQRRGRRPDSVDRPTARADADRAMADREWSFAFGSAFPVVFRQVRLSGRTGGAVPVKETGSRSSAAESGRNPSQPGYRQSNGGGAGQNRGDCSTGLAALRIHRLRTRNVLFGTP